MITSKIAELRKKELAFETKYKCDYQSFSQRIAEDEAFVTQIEQHVNKLWESELAEWEFSHKGIDDWTKALRNILMML